MRQRDKQIGAIKRGTEGVLWAKPPTAGVHGGRSSQPLRQFCDFFGKNSLFSAVWITICEFWSHVKDLNF